MEPKHKQAFNLYFQTDLTQQQIADLLEINRKTLYTWIKQGSWARAKYAARHAPCILIDQYYSQLHAMNKEISGREERPYPTKEEAEIMRKLGATIKQIRPTDKMTSTENVELMTDFLDHIQRQDPAVVDTILPHLDKYVDFVLDKGQGLNFSLEKQKYNDEQADKEYESWLAKQPMTEKPVMVSEVEPHPDLSEKQSRETPLNVTLSPGEGRGEAASIFTQWGANGASKKSEKPTKPLPTATSTENDNTELSTKNNIANGANTNFVMVSEAEPQLNNPSLRGTKKSHETQERVIVSEVEPRPDLSGKQSHETPLDLTLTPSLSSRVPEGDERSSAEGGRVKEGRGEAADHWGKFLEDHYKISQDPYVVRKNNITIIRHGSPLWGKRQSLFF